MDKPTKEIIMATKPGKYPMDPKNPMNPKAPEDEKPKKKPKKGWSTMPCMKCSNGKWKYGEAGRCQFATLSSCEAAERAIHARESGSKMKSPYFEDKKSDVEDYNSKPYND